MKIYEIHNPLFLNDIFVFGEIEGIGMCYIKVNYHNKIEEIGIDIQARMNKTIDDILKFSKKVAKIRRHIFNSISIEYWAKTQKDQLRSVNAGTYIEHNSGTIII